MPVCVQCGVHFDVYGGGFAADSMVPVWYCNPCWTEWYRAGVEEYLLRLVGFRHHPVVRAPTVVHILSTFLNQHVWP